MSYLSEFPPVCRLTVRLVVAKWIENRAWFSHETPFLTSALSKFRRTLQTISHRLLCLFYFYLSDPPHKTHYDLQATISHKQKCPVRLRRCYAWPCKPQGFFLSSWDCTCFVLSLYLVVFPNIVEYLINNHFPVPKFSNFNIPPSPPKNMGHKLF